MYTEVSAELKSDFYSRYGEVTGNNSSLFFERTGFPCVLMDSGSKMLAFSMHCGVRAYGRGYGDVLRIMNADSNICDIKFRPGGAGAQILYRQDVENMPWLEETVDYTVNKLLMRMHRSRSGISAYDPVDLCDRYGSNGWCAYLSGGHAKQLPFPLLDENVLFIRIGKTGIKYDPISTERFCSGESERIAAAAEGLRACRTDVLFEMLCESERAVEMLLSPSKRAVCAVRAAMSADGVYAARICSGGVVCFVSKEYTDSAMHTIEAEYERELGSKTRILVVK